MSKRKTLIDVALQEIDRKIAVLEETRRELLAAVATEAARRSERRRPGRASQKVTAIANNG